MQSSTVDAMFDNSAYDPSGNEISHVRGVLKQLNGILATTRFVKRRVEIT